MTSQEYRNLLTDICGQNKRFTQFTFLMWYYGIGERCI